MPHICPNTPRLVSLNFITCPRLATSTYLQFNQKCGSSMICPVTYGVLGGVYAPAGTVTEEGAAAPSSMGPCGPPFTSHPLNHYHYLNSHAIAAIVRVMTEGGGLHGQGRFEARAIKTEPRPVPEVRAASSNGSPAAGVSDDDAL